MAYPSVKRGGSVIVVRYSMYSKMSDFTRLAIMPVAGSPDLNNPVHMDYSTGFYMFAVTAENIILSFSI